MKRAHEFMVAFRESGGDMSQLAQEIGAIVGEPARFLDDPMREALARALYVAGVQAARDARALAAVGFRARSRKR